MGLLEKIGLRNKEESKVETVKVDEQTLKDAEWIVRFLKGQMFFFSSIDMRALGQQFAFGIGKQGDETNVRLKRALSFLAKYKCGLDWDDRGDSVSFDRKRLQMPILVQ